MCLLFSFSAALIYDFSGIGRIHRDRSLWVQSHFYKNPNVPWFPCNTAILSLFPAHTGHSYGETTWTKLNNKITHFNLIYTPYRHCNENISDYLKDFMHTGGLTIAQTQKSILVTHTHTHTGCLFGQFHSSHCTWTFLQAINTKLWIMQAWKSV